MQIVVALVVIAVMIVLCFFLSGLSNGAGTIFERKSTVTKKDK